MNRWGRRLAWGLATLVVTLLGAEAVLRYGVGIGDPVVARRDAQAEYVLVPSARYRRFGNTIAINANGLRGPELGPKAPSEVRVALIGDSIVYGGHRLDQDETIGAYLTRALSARLPGCAVTVAPVAASSWGPENQRAFVRREGFFGADAVVYVLSSHDAFDVPTFVYGDMSYAMRPYHGGLHEASGKVWDRRPRMRDDEPVRPDRAEARARSEAAAGDVLAEAKASGAALVLLAEHPTVTELNLGSERSRPFVPVAAAADVPALDLANALGPIGQAAYQDHLHLTAIGTRAVAGRLAEVIAPTLAEVGACTG